MQHRPNSSRQSIRQIVNKPTVNPDYLNLRIKVTPDMFLIIPHCKETTGSTAGTLKMEVCL